MAVFGRRQNLDSSVKKLDSEIKQAEKQLSELGANSSPDKVKEQEKDIELLKNGDPRARDEIYKKGLIALQKEYAQYVSDLQKYSHGNEDSEIRYFGAKIIEMRDKASHGVNDVDLAQNLQYVVRIRADLTGKAGGDEKKLSPQSKSDLAAITDESLKKLATAKLTSAQAKDYEQAIDHIQKLRSGTPITTWESKNYQIGDTSMKELAGAMLALSKKVAGGVTNKSDADWKPETADELSFIRVRLEELTSGHAPLTERQRGAANQMWNQYTRLTDWWSGKTPVNDLKDADFAKIDETLNYVSPDRRIIILANNLKDLNIEVTNAKAWSKPLTDRLNTIKQDFETLAGDVWTFNAAQLYLLSEKMGPYLGALGASATANGKVEQPVFDPAEFETTFEQNKELKNVDSDFVSGVLSARLQRIAQEIVELRVKVAGDDNAWYQESVTARAKILERYEIIKRHTDVSAQQGAAKKLIETQLANFKQGGKTPKTDPQEEFKAVIAALNAAPADPKAKPGAAKPAPTKPTAPTAAEKAEAAKNAAITANNGKITSLLNDIKTLSETVDKKTDKKFEDADKAQLKKLQDFLTLLQADKAIEENAAQKASLTEAKTQLDQLDAWAKGGAAAPIKPEQTQTAQSKLPKPAAPPAPTTPPATGEDKVTSAMAEAVEAQAERDSAAIRLKTAQEKADVARIDANINDVNRAAQATIDASAASIPEMIGRGVRGVGGAAKDTVDYLKVESDDPVTRTTNDVIQYGLDFFSSSTNFAGRAFRQATSTKTGQSWLGIGGGVVGGFGAAWLARSFLIENTFLKNVPFAGFIVSTLAFAAGFLGARKMIHSYFGDGLLQGNGQNFTDPDADDAKNNPGFHHDTGSGHHGAGHHGGGHHDHDGRDCDEDHTVTDSTSTEATGWKTTKADSVTVEQKAPVKTQPRDISCTAQGHEGGATPCIISLARDPDDRALINEARKIEDAQTHSACQSNVNGGHVCNVFPLRPDNYVPGDIRGRDTAANSFDMTRHDQDGLAPLELVSSGGGGMRPTPGAQPGGWRR